MTEQTQTLISFITDNKDKLYQQGLQHIGLTCLSLVISVLIGVPAGIIISRKPRLAGLVIGVAGIMQTIPSIALLGFMIPIFGIGVRPAIIALSIYALLPIIRSTYTGISAVDKQVKEAAEGLGMYKSQVLVKIELPLAMPFILTGIRTAAVINVGVATLAAYVAAGGFGEFIFGGISLNNSNMILAGAIPSALLAILLDYLIGFGERLSISRMRMAYFLVPLLFLICGFTLFSKTADKLRIGYTPEFIGRKDGDAGLRERYGLKVKPLVVNDAIMYKALKEKQLDVVSGYSTDGRIKSFDLISLEDDKKLFPLYYAAPIIREPIAARHPELVDAVNLLSGRINDSVMTLLNYKVDYLHQSPAKVAKEFLSAQGLWRPDGNGSGIHIRIGSKIFAEQYILTEIYKMLIEGYTDLSVDTKPGLGGTEICFEALRSNEIDMYPEYTGTGLLVVLKVDDQTRLKLNESRELSYDFVKKEFLQRYRIRWLSPIGFNNTYALMMRRKDAEQLGISSITDLSNYINTGR